MTNAPRPSAADDALRLLDEAWSYYDIERSEPAADEDSAEYEEIPAAA